MSDISPLRSFVFLGLVIATVLVTGITVVEWHEQSKPYPQRLNLQPSMVMMIFSSAARATSFVSIAGTIVMIETDRTKERRAMTTHFYVSVWLSTVLCYSRIPSVGRMTRWDHHICLNMVIWTFTVGMISAIWMRGGLEALKREAMAVPGNLWLTLYE